MFLIILPTSGYEVRSDCMACRVCRDPFWSFNLVHIGEKAMLYFIFGLQFIICTIFFIRTCKLLKNISLYQDLRSRISKMWYFLPPVICILTCILSAYLTEYIFTSILLWSIISPLMSIHFLNEPFVLKNVSTPEHFRDAAYRRVIALGIRSRILVIGVTVNLLLMSYVFINS